MNVRLFIRRLTAIFLRELQIFGHRPMFLFCMIVAPILCVVFFTTLMQAGLPTKLPAAIVDEDNTHISRIICRTIDAFQETHIIAHYRNFSDAREAMQRGEIYAFFYISEGTTEKALTSKQPKIAFYTNETYFVPGNLLMRDMRYASELTGLALTRETLYAHGATERQAMGILQPIVIETHPLNNPTLDYSVYLTNILLPGILILLIMLSTTYTIGLEWKLNKQKEWFRMADESAATALLGKLLPQTVLFSIMVIFYDIYLYRFLQFPCHCGILVMMGVSILTVVSSQAFGVFLFGAFIGQMRLSMCLCSLWGILSFSLAGFTYPTTAMDPIMAKLSFFFPLRHYYLIYVNEALNGYPIRYAWGSVINLLLLSILPLLVLKRYHVAFEKYHYLP